MAVRDTPATQAALHHQVMTMQRDRRAHRTDRPVMLVQDLDSGPAPVWERLEVIWLDQ